jgi:exonuclease VII large subunit
VSRLDVAERFPVTLQRRAWLPLVPAAAAFALCFLADPTRPTPNDASANTVAINSKQIQESVKPLQKNLKEGAEQASKDGLKDLEDLFKKAEEGTRDLAKKDDGDRREALGKLNDLAKQLDERREKLAEGEKLKEQLAGMKNLPSGPADKLAKDMKNGDFGKALKELEKLKEQLAQGKLDPKSKSSWPSNWRP